jgi:MtrB/PioB family decaheme-associated outer membrane protein
MNKPLRKHPASSVAAAVLAAVQSAVAAPSDAPSTAAPDASQVDTSAWTCTQCPFLRGHEGSIEGGAIYADGANAVFGRYTGIDHTGKYADAAADGQWRDEQGRFANYDFERLGLASREGVVNGGQEGRYDLRLAYDSQPQDLYDTATTPLKIETERRSASLFGRYFAAPDWTLFGGIGHEEKDGSALASASFVTQALQFAEPIDYRTNSLDAGAAWSGRTAGLRLAYTGSWFDDANGGAVFPNPYAAGGAPANGELAEAPGNNLQQGAATGNWQIPWLASTLSYDVSVGRLRQDAGFLPISTASAATVPGVNSLDGVVHLSHYSLALSTRPLGKLILRGRATYDGRDDATRPIAVNYVVTDVVPGGTAITPRYGEDRARLDGTADTTLWRLLHLGVGGEFLHVHYAPGQVLTHTQDVESWVRASVNPISSVTVALKYGDGLRKDSPTNLEALPFGESTLVRDYNYAGRDRVFSTLTASWAASATVTWALQGALTKDDYRSSPLGLQSLHEQRYSTTLTWTPRDTLSAYLDAGYQRFFTWQNGATDVLSSPWMVSDAERFWNMSVGGRWVPQQRWTLTLDYLLAPSTGDTDSALGGASQSFPRNWTKLDSTRFGASYQWTPACALRFRYVRETYDSADWALAGVGPGTIPNFLAFGIDPYHDSVNLFALSLRYQF